MKIKKYSNKKEEKIKEAMGLDGMDFDGAVTEDSFAVCENTMTSKCGAPFKRDKTWGFSSSVCQNGKPFDFGASGGSTSPNTEVNADSQGVIDETLGPSQYKKQ